MIVIGLIGKKALFKNGDYNVAVSVLVIVILLEWLPSA